eukprot:5452294-Alexandrium_andersonii.AAC.1
MAVPLARALPLRAPPPSRVSAAIAMRQGTRLRSAQRRQPTRRIRIRRRRRRSRRAASRPSR